MIISQAKNCGPTLHLHAAACCVIQIGNQSSDGRQIQELETSRKSENHKPKNCSTGVNKYNNSIIMQSFVNHCAQLAA